MPPVLSPRVDKETILSIDPEIAGIETHPLVFTDITYGIQDQMSLIVENVTNILDDTSQVILQNRTVHVVFLFFLSHVAHINQ